MTQELVAVMVKPRASRAGLALAPDGGVIVRVHAPAVEGAANRELVEAFAAAVGVPKSAVHLVRGQKSRAKQLSVDGLTAAQVHLRLRHTLSAEEARRD
jgi:uncharacterized protein